MKRIVCLLLIVCLVGAASSIGFGQLIPGTGEISPNFVSAGNVKTSITPTLGMKLNLYAGLMPKNDNSADQVRITLKVMNFVTGSVIHNETYTAEYNYLTAYYEAKDTCNVTIPGNYYMQVTYKPYKNGVLQETITQNSTMVSIG